MGRRILIAEDSPTQAAHLRELLEGAGYEVEHAANGREALERLESTLPDLIISDVLMPELDGLAFCQAVKAAPATRHIPFVILTVLNTPVDVIIGLERGADNFITKPCADELLLARVGRIFENLRLRQAGQGNDTVLAQVGDRQIPIAADKQQIVELLIAILEEVGQISHQLVESERVMAEHHRKQLWMERTRQALEQDRMGFVLYYQPVLHLPTDTISHFELLLRMVTESGETIPPTEFLAVAEQTGVIREIDRWVSRKAIHLWADHHRAGRDLHLNINLSGRAFLDPELLPLIQSELTATGSDPSYFTFEITETAVISNFEHARRFISELRALGCRFALDDFGVGYSSFDYLKHLPVDLIKVDGSFIREVRHSQMDQHLVRAMVDVARALGKGVVAEWVGDPEALEFLRSCGVDYAQGYHIGRPAAAPSLD